MAAPKSRLGRGLGGIIAGGGAKKTAVKKTVAKTDAPKAEAAPKATPAPPAGPYREIAVAAIVPNPYQPRREMDPAHVEELANSIRSEGLLQPIVVRTTKEKDQFELIAGERRWRAHQKLGLKTIAARVMDASDASSAVISLIENLQREGLNPIEEALGYASLMKDFDLTQEAVSDRIGRPRASIANTLRLLALDREIQGYLAKGMLSTGHAKVLLGVEDPAQRLILARRAIEAGMSVREVEKQVKRIKSESNLRKDPASHDAASETVVRDLEKQISSRLNTKVQLKHTPKKGRLIIEYYGNEDLQRILERTGLQ
ncbi:ParB/RepB/Spo0J family partition protein [Cerasicoccus maritimus]|uniref:ParB/RepB/Spo0J family partition protein n=1 Tax=Cerasicoccus maritimus TaxID=490089 RepID=UPI0028528192|nr:ParB/RepB/Spo0J family partition protein [Cerasicoccus maritimus]